MMLDIELARARVDKLGTKLHHAGATRIAAAEETVKRVASIQSTATQAAEKLRTAQRATAARRTEGDSLYYV